MRGRAASHILLILAISLGISAVVAPLAPRPEPKFHDEFSYLLAADTFAHGRLTNEPHKLWPFFETFHVIQQPTYMSKYQPGQGLVLALGQVLGHPIIGVWISTAIACACVWMGLIEFMPKRWATLGAFLAATHPLMLTWNHGYWGGAVPTIGGALLIGGIARFARRGDVGAGLKFGIGAFVLMISRPYEGIVVGLLSVAVLRSARVALAKRRSRAVGLATASVVLAIGVASVGYSNWRVTGRATRLPYLEYESQHAITPPVSWLPWSGKIPQYRHDAMRDYYVSWWLPIYERQRTLRGFSLSMREKGWDFATNYLSAIGLVIPLLMAPLLVRRDRILQRALLVAILFTLIIFGNLGFYPHYASPSVAVYLLIVVQALRHVRARFRTRVGRWIVRVVVLAQVVALIVWFARLDRTRDDWHFRRADLIAEKMQMGGKHLIIVRHEPGAVIHSDWVFNDANIDASPVVWARDMGSEANRALLDHFADRSAWRMTVDANGARIDPYRRSTSSR